MIKIKINTNDNNKESKEFIVSQKKLTKLRELEFIGGFKRFTIDVIDERIKYRPVNYEYLIDWLIKHIFPNSTKILLKTHLEILD